MKTQFLLRAALATALAAMPFAWGPAARAQGGDNLMPAASAAKARALLEQSIQALGGDAYLRLHDADCMAKVAGFEKSGSIGAIGEVHVLRQLPDKNRTEYDKKGDIVTVYAGDKGWTLDRSGVDELGADDISAYQEQLKNDANFILRYRLNEPGLILRYDGTEVVDLKQVDWVEAGDKGGGDVRIAIDRASHLPVRFVVQSRDTEGAPSEMLTVYSNYHAVDGIQTAFQISRFRNGVQVSQVFYLTCQYNTGLSDDLFSRVSLDRHFKRKK